MLLEYFQMVDRVVDMDVGAGTVRCQAQVPDRSTIFEGHFPGHPLLPATLLIEAMAQSSGFLLLSRLEFERLPYLIQVDKAKIRSFVEPGTALVVLGALVHDGSGFAVTEGEVHRDGDRIVSAEMRFRTMPFPRPELREVVKQYATSVGLAV